MFWISFFRYCLLLAFFWCLAGCSSLPKRIPTDKGLKLSADETESVMVHKVDDYVDDVVTNVKGWERPKVNPVIKNVSWLFIAISGVLFVLGFGCFIVAYLTHFYKANAVGFICLAGSGVAIGFAELAPFMWVVPAAAVLGALIWYITHQNKDFSLWQWFSSKFS